MFSEGGELLSVSVIEFFLGLLTADIGNFSYKLSTRTSLNREVFTKNCNLYSMCRITFIAFFLRGVLRWLVCVLPFWIGSFDPWLSDEFCSLELRWCPEDCRFKTSLAFIRFHLQKYENFMLSDFCWLTSTCECWLEVSWLTSTCQSCIICVFSSYLHFERSTTRTDSVRYR